MSRNTAHIGRPSLVGIAACTLGALDAQLDFPLPSELSVGAGTAVFVGGWCFSPQADISSLELEVDGERQRLLAYAMPRRDVFAAYHPELEPVHETDDSLLRSWCSGFWGLAKVAPRPAGACELGLRARLSGSGRELSTTLAQIPIAAPSQVAPALATIPPARDLVAVAMATYNPPGDLLARQLDSIRAQTHRNWVCVISDDCSDPDRFELLRAAVADDPRFVISRSPRRRGFYRNFERALAMVPPRVPYVALADQDDAWHPRKLAVLLERIGSAQLVYSNARIVDSRGELISGTYWSSRRNNHSDMLSLLVANSVSGAASLLRADLLELALPFPPAQFLHYHDHWLALVALALGEIAFVDEPLYDYVQHRQAWLGHAAANRMISFAGRLASLQHDPRERVRRWRVHYFIDACRLMQFATVLLIRCSQRMAPDKRRALERFLAADRSPGAVAGLAVRGARELVGTPETLGAEWMLGYAFAWHRAMAGVRRLRPGRPTRLDAVPPTTLFPHPELDGLRSTPAQAVAEKIAPLALAIDERAPQRVNVLIPTIDMEHLFGGYIAKFNLARRLAEQGYRVRLVTVDPVGPLPRSWRQRIESYSGLAGLFERVEVAFGRESPGLEMSRTDRFVASTWWTAHIAHAAGQVLSADRFVYLIQEYEPFTFPMGSYFALAQESYSFPHAALFSSELLRDYFRLHRIGVFAGGETPGEERSAVFENAITDVRAPTVGELSGRRERKLLFYARPEPHGARNMFELGVLGLRAAAAQETFDPSWRLHGVGSLGRSREVTLSDGLALRLLPRSGQRDYEALLRDHDVGLALMYTPHPSLVPLEMAAAGVLTVTNTFANKTAERLAELSSNLIAAEPTVTGIAGALRQATAGVADYERRLRGSSVRWSRDWNRSFDGQQIARVAGWLRLPAPGDR